MLDKVIQFSIARVRALALTFKLFGAMTVLVMATLGTATTAQATPLLWTLHIQNAPVNVVGSFVYDADLDQYSNFSFTVSGLTAPVGSGLDYTPGNGVYDNFTYGDAKNIWLWRDANNNGILDYGGTTLSGQDWGINVTFDVVWGITDAGGTVGIHIYSIGTCYNDNSGNYGILPCDARWPRFTPGDMTGNYITANAITPLPAALPLFLSGLGGFGFMVWCRRKAVAARAA